MKQFLNLPIRLKLFGIILFSSGAALILSMIAITIYDSLEYTSQRSRELQAQAAVLGKISIAALAFNDQKTAAEYLGALRLRNHIVAAATYTEDGQLFATYTRDAASYAFPAINPPGYHIQNDDITLFHNIEQNAQPVGTIFLHAKLGRLPRIAQIVGILLSVMLVSLGLSLWISRRLQSIISTPVLEIAAVANSVITKKNYALRTAKYNADEIGSLADAFNQMLDYIQERDANVIAVNQSLQREIDARMRIQISLKENIEELARSNAELEQFAYVSSHDLQEPLRMVASYTQLVEKHYSTQFDEKGLLYLHYIVDGAKRMQELIDDLLAFSRVGKLGKEFHAVSLYQPVKLALRNLDAQISASAAEINIDSELPTVMGDPVQLTQIFQNLLSNAIKFRGENPSRIGIYAKKLNDFWEVTVKDNGIGIDREHFDRIFMIFQRLHGHTQYPGSGIGLAICKKIVERHGGRIWLESTPGMGSSFHFTLREKDE